MSTSGADLAADLAADVAAVQALGPIDKILHVLARATGLRIALAARVTEADWVACAVLDQAGFGIGPGDTLDVETTY